MFKDFSTTLAQKFTEFLSKHPDFFTISEKKRTELVESVRLPKAFKEYLLNVNEKHFINDLSLILKYVKSRSKRILMPSLVGSEMCIRDSIKIKGSPFFKALVNFLISDFAAKLDHFDYQTALMDKKHLTELVNTMITSSTPLANTLKQILLTRTYQQMASSIYELAQKVEQSPYIVVQSPREIDTKLKREIRREIIIKNPNTLPIFQINRKLIGGIRVFVDGESRDYSWLSRVLRFTSLTKA